MNTAAGGLENIPHWYRVQIQDEIYVQRFRQKISCDSKGFTELPWKVNEGW